MIRIRLALITVLFSSLIAAQFGSAYAADSRQLTIIHTGNTFNRIQEYAPFKQPPRGGVARRATVIKELRTSHPNSLLVSSGSDVMGTPMFAQYGGVASADVMSLLGYDIALASGLDIMAGGNVNAFKAYRSTASYPLVNSNLDLSKLVDTSVPPNTVLTVQGVKVGVFGLSNERSATQANFAGAINVLDTDNAIQTNLKALQDQQVDIVILLSSMGIERDKEVAAKYSGKNGIDVIVGSDSSQVLGAAADLAPNDKAAGTYPLVVNEKTTPTVLVYSGQFGAYLGELNLSFDAQGLLTNWAGRIHFLDEKIKPDPTMQQHVDKLAAGISMTKITIGEAKVDLFGSSQEFPWQENPLANVYADAFLEYGKPYGATVALVNAGAVWGTINKGPITLADLYRVQPFFNWLIVMDLTGDQLRLTLEHGLSTYGGPVQLSSGRFLHVAGLTYTYDPTLAVGKRVIEILVGGKALDPKAIYPIVVNSFMADGGDEFTMLRQASNVFNTGIPVTDTLQQYAQAHTPLDAPASNRIKRIGN